MLRSLAAATMPLLFAACAGSTPPKPQDTAAQTPPPLQIQFMGARPHSSAFLGYVNPTETFMQRQIAPGRALFIDKTTAQRFQFNCAALGKIMDEGLIDLNLSPDSKERRALKANMDQIIAGYTALRCGRNLDA